MAALKLVVYHLCNRAPLNSGAQVCRREIGMQRPLSTPSVYTSTWLYALCLHVPDVALVVIIEIILGCRGIK